MHADGHTELGSDAMPCSARAAQPRVADAGKHNFSASVRMCRLNREQRVSFGMAAAVGIISPQPDLTNTPDLSDTDSAWVNRTEMIGFKLQPQTGGFKRCEAFVLAPLRLFSWVLARCWLPTIPHSLAYPVLRRHSAGHSKCGFSYQRRLGRANGPSRNCSLFQLRYWPGPWNLAHRVAPRGRYRRRQSDDYGYWRRSILRG